MKTAIALVALAAMLSACGGEKERGKLVLRRSNEMTHTYAEGYKWFVALDDAKPGVIETDTVTLEGDAGTHALRSFVRPCDGNCAYLDPPVQRCTADVPLDPKPTVMATYHLKDGGCSITVSASG